MKIYPYSKIETTHLKPLLISARVLGGLSYLLFFGALVIVAFGLVSSMSGPVALEGGHIVKMSTSASPFILIGLSVSVSAICLLVFSGLCAAIVSCEYKFTSTVE